MKRLKEYKKFYEEEGKIIRCDNTNKDTIIRFKHMIYPILPKNLKK